jgi:glycosyltransferase involved in cell wall biosynthesis
MTIGDEVPEVSVIMPCLNEAETLEVCLRKAQGAIQQHGLAAEIIVADNGSRDGSRDIAEWCGVRVVVVSERGYGNALRGGIEAARGRLIIMGDADDSYDFCEIYPFIEKLREGYDLVMGTRLKGTIMTGAMPWLNRWLGNPVLTGIGRLFFSSSVSDFHCGLRAFSREAYHRMNLVTTGMEFASEMVMKAAFSGMRIAEVPISFYKDGRSGPPHLRRWRDGWRHLRFMLLYSPRWLFLYPGVALMLLGLGTGLWLLPHPRAIGNVTLDVHTLVYAAMAVVIGFQTIAFAFFTKIFAITEGLLPEDPRLNRLFRYVTLEVGLIVGGALLLIGLAGSLYAFGAWGAHSFGPLDPPRTLRIVIPAVTALTLGCQIVLSSFFLSVLGLRRR